MDLLEKGHNSNRSHSTVFSHMDKESFFWLFTVPETDPIFGYCRDYSSEQRVLVIGMSKTFTDGKLWKELYDAVRGI